VAHIFYEYFIGAGAYELGSGKAFSVMNDATYKVLN
jgi:hypothetical protein